MSPELQPTGARAHLTQSRRTVPTDMRWCDTMLTQPRNDAWKLGEAVLMAFQHIVVAVDGSASSREALERGIELARRGHELTIVGIEEPWPVHAGAKSRASGNGHLDAIVADAVGHALQAGVQAHGQVLQGYPAEVLVKFSAEHGCDLVVLGAGPRVSTWLGSTADKVVDRATCAVLVVR